MTRDEELQKVRSLTDEQLETYRHLLLRKLADAAEERQRRKGLHAAR